MLKSKNGKLDVDSFYEEFRIAKDVTHDWREDAFEAFDFVAGKQFNDEDYHALTDRGHPALVYNLIAPLVKKVKGLEASTREMPYFRARVTGSPQGGVSDIMNAAYSYAVEDSRAISHISQAYDDLVVCGMGWTVTEMNWATNPDGDITVAKHLDPMYCFWDPRTKHNNLDDSKWRCYIHLMDWDEFDERWPDPPKEFEIGTYFDLPEKFSVRDHHEPVNEWSQAYNELFKGHHGDNPFPGHGRKHAEVAQVQWWEDVLHYRISAPELGDFTGTAKEWRDFKKANPEAAMAVRAMPFKKRTYYQAWVAGNAVLESDLNVCPDSFTLLSMTGNKSRNDGTWYGLVKDAIDPQMWVNKAMSLYIENMAKSNKPGIMVEADAHPNIRELEERWSDPGYIPTFRSGALATGKVMPKPLAQPDSRALDILNFNKSIIPEIAGMSADFMGTNEKVEPYALARARMNTSVTTLSYLTDSKRDYLAQQARVVAYLIRKHMANGRIIRVSGEGVGEYIPLMRDELAMEYDVGIAPAPTSADNNELILSGIVLFLQNGGKPTPEFIKYIPGWPERLKQKVYEDATKPDPIQGQIQQKSLERIDAENAKIQAEAHLYMARASAENVKPAIEQAKLQTELMKTQGEVEEARIRAAAIQVDSMSKQMVASGEMELKVMEFMAKQEESNRVFETALTGMMSKNSTDTSGIIADAGNSLAEIAYKVDEIAKSIQQIDDEADEEVVYGDDGRVVSVGNRRLVRNEDGAVVKIESAKKRGAK